MPLIYGGQEVGLSKRLRFFDKDTIVWSESPWTPFYKKMVELKSANPALMNGEKGADMFRIKSVNPFIYAFTRENEEGKVLSIFNFSKEKQTVTLTNDVLVGSYIDWFSGEEIKLDATKEFNLEPWGFVIYVKK